ncbi:MAG: patatin-like phospholipase family protein [Xanthomonadales bacterium]|nr:patatin-like phospholipase family protein [Xanthomonadales bacterium]
MAATAPDASLASHVAGYDTIALALQGGGALGAYQAGVYEALDEAGILPNRLSGISIGALNSAIIAGNPPGQRVGRLHEFWDTICSTPRAAAWVDPTTWPASVVERLGELAAWRTVLAGQPGFFHPRVLPPIGFGLRATPDQVSWYDTAPLRDTLERLVDFDRLNDERALHVVVSAVNVRNGNFTRFDNRRQRLGAEHFMASGALPPGLPPIEIDGEYYWDGGVVSNTPLYEVLEGHPGHETLVFQVDLWSARGALPHDLVGAAERRKEIQYSSRTRFFTEFMRHTQEQRRLVHDLMALVPEAQRDKAAYRRAEAQQSADLTNVIHLIYTSKPSGAHFRDFEFSRDSMHRHWQAGLDDMRQTLSHPDWLAPPDPTQPFVTHDLHRIQPA